METNRIYNKVSYDWKIEVTDKNGDIPDQWEGLNLKDLDHYKNRKPEIDPVHGQCRYVLVLTRIVWNDWDGNVDQGWAYPENNEMPTEFDNGIKVPKRFLIEYEKVWKLK
tara:strand:+ start:2958 stop:3287 length:330 start_codon:yes stop_codon:yes gene_type:complete